MLVSYYSHWQGSPSSRKYKYQPEKCKVSLCYHRLLQTITSKSVPVAMPKYQTSEEHSTADIINPVLVLQTHTMPFLSVCPAVQLVHLLTHTKTTQKKQSFILIKFDWEYAEQLSRIKGYLFSFMHQCEFFWWARPGMVIKAVAHCPGRPLNSRTTPHLQQHKYCSIATWDCQMCEVSQRNGTLVRDRCIAISLKI